MANKIQLRRGVASAWTGINPVLGAGEPGYEIDTGKIKIGDGVTLWNSLAYLVADATSSGGTPDDGSVTNAKVASGAAISADKLADGTTNKVFLATERTKLTGVATSATANSSDATLLNRANHTGTQAASTITGLANVATTGSYTDLINKALYIADPTVYDDSNLTAALASAPSTATLVAVKVAGT